MPYKFNPFSQTFDYYQAGSSTNSFVHVQPITGTTPTAASPTDTLTLASDGSLGISGNSSTDTVTFSVAQGVKSAYRPPVAAIDTSSTSLPTGASVTVDGYTVANGDRILFSALSVNNGRVYVASGIGSSVVWTLAIDGQAGDGTPTNGDTVAVKNGTYFGFSRWTYYGGAWFDGYFVKQINISNSALSTVIQANTRPLLQVSMGAGWTGLVSFSGSNQAGLFIFDTYAEFAAAGAAIVPHIVAQPDNYADIGTKDGGTTLQRFRDIYAARDFYAGNGFKVKEGTNQRMGTVTLSSGTVVVSNTSVTSNTRIFLTVQTASGTQGFLSTTRSAGTSFTINSSSASDASTVAWLLVEPY